MAGKVSGFRFHDAGSVVQQSMIMHMTFFFNDGVEVPNEGADRFLIPSPKVATYDMQPEMSAQAVCVT